MLTLKFTAILMTDQVQITDAAKNLSRSLFILFTCLLLVSSSPARGDFQAGMDAYNRGDYATAFTELKLLAELGHAEAQNKLGNMYETGMGLEQDYFVAYLWFYLAAIRGNDDARKNRDRVAENLTDNQIADAQYQAAIKRLLEITGIINIHLINIYSIQNLKPPYLNYSQQSWNELVTKLFFIPVVETLMSNFKKHFNHEEIRKLSTFSESPVGKKLVEIQLQVGQILIKTGREDVKLDSDISDINERLFKSYLTFLTDEEIEKLSTFSESPVAKKLDEILSQINMEDEILPQINMELEKRLNMELEKILEKSMHNLSEEVKK